MLKGKWMTRRNKAYLSCFGTVQIYKRNPIVIAWWSAAFPGIGHMLLNMHIKGNILFLCEILINVFSRLNLSMMYTFTGAFEEAGLVLDPRWSLIYLPFYSFCIWDSYRSAVDMNKLTCLVDPEPVRMKVFDMNDFEICYLDKRIPWISAAWSLLFPGLGQLYARRTLTAFSLLLWTLVITYFSHDLQGLVLLMKGCVTESTQVVDMEWILFFPSLIFGSAFDAYTSTIASNRLFDKELDDYLKDNWSPDWRFLYKKGRMYP